MISNRFRIFCSLSAVLLAASACALPLAGPAAPTRKISTAQPLALSATTLTEPTTLVPTTQPEPMTPVPTAQPEQSTETANPTGGATETATLPVGVFPTESPTPTLEPVFAEVMKQTDCRTGPGGHYDLVATYQTGARLQVLAKDLGGGFIFVQNPDKPEEQCYILANNVKLSGDASILPQYTPLASPTAAPSFTATFKKFDLCKGDVIAQFIIKNNGSVPFRSAYIRVTNLKTNESAEKAADAFDLTTACIIAKNIAPLNPGETGYLSTDVFLHDPRGNKMRAVIQVCTEKSLKGFCLNTIVNIAP